MFQKYKLRVDNRISICEENLGREINLNGREINLNANKLILHE